MGEQRDEMVTRQERREKRLDKKKERMPQHGRAMAHIYKQAVEKRVGKQAPSTNIAPIGSAMRGAEVRQDGKARNKSK